MKNKTRKNKKENKSSHHDNDSIKVEKLIIKICQKNIEPQEQSGDIFSFERLTYADNELISKYTIKQLYDRIRMVDGLDYQRAYINFGQNKIEFTEAHMDQNCLFAKIKIEVKK